MVPHIYFVGSFSLARHTMPPGRAGETQGFRRSQKPMRWRGRRLRLLLPPSGSFDRHASASRRCAAFGHLPGDAATAGGVTLKTDRGSRSTSRTNHYGVLAPAPRCSASSNTFSRSTNARLTNLLHDIVPLDDVRLSAQHDFTTQPETYPYAFSLAAGYRDPYRPATSADAHLSTNVIDDDWPSGHPTAREEG